MNGASQMSLASMVKNMKERSATPHATVLWRTSHGMGWRDV